MATVLEEIIAGVREDMAHRQKTVSLDDLKDRVHRQTSALNALKALRGSAPETLEVIAEVKRSSPSKGALSSIESPADLAASYEAGGAAVISVLTEQRRFGGSLDDLKAVRERVNIPVLRKDFTVDEYQIWEARAFGADMVLLIVAALDDATLTRFLDLTHELGMNALVETHTEEEIERALAVNAQIIGVNVRNLKTLEVDNANFANLAEHLPAERMIIAESGVLSTDHVADYAAHGAQAILVGEALVRSGEPTDAVQAFRAAGTAARQTYLDSTTH